MPALAAFTPGRDYHPGVDFDNDTATTPAMHLALEDAVILDAVNAAGTVVVYYQMSQDVWVADYDLTTGLIDNDHRDTVLVHDTHTGSYESNGISGAGVQFCHALTVADDTLSPVTGITYGASHIGISPASISVWGDGCSGTPTYEDGFKIGYGLGAVYFRDRFDVGNTGGCTAVHASYKYTDCSFSPSLTYDYYHCPTLDDPDTNDTDTDASNYSVACRFFMIYEGRYTDTDSFDNHVFLMAHSREAKGPWVRYLPGGDALPDSDDVILYNTGPHQLGSAGDYSLTGGPSLLWDNGDQVWRTWFSGDPDGYASTMYSESPNDGQGWGIGTYAEAPTAPDCFDSGTPGWDSTVCGFLGWNSTPGDPPDISGSVMDPDVQDPDVILANIDTDTPLELLMFSKGADGSCSTGGPQDGVILVSVHESLGDMSADSWVWDTTVERDSDGYGRVLDMRSYACPNDPDSGGDTTWDHLADPTTMADPLGGGEFGYIMFYEMQGDIYVAGSNFACSDFEDNDADSAVDYGDDVGCESPTDNAEN